MVQIACVNLRGSGNTGANVMRVATLTRFEWKQRDERAKGRRAGWNDGVSGRLAANVVFPDPWPAEVVSWIKKTPRGEEIGLLEA